MRYFAVSEGWGGTPAPLHIISEYVGGLDEATGSLTRRDGVMDVGRERARSEAELLSTAEGRRALEAWRSGDDSIAQKYEQEALASIRLRDDQEMAGFKARPDLYERWRELIEAHRGDESDELLDEIRAAGAVALAS